MRQGEAGKMGSGITDFGLMAYALAFAALTTLGQGQLLRPSRGLGIGLLVLTGLTGLSGAFWPGLFVESALFGGAFVVLSHASSAAITRLELPKRIRIFVFSVAMVGTAGVFLTVFFRVIPGGHAD